MYGSAQLAHVDRFGLIAFLFGVFCAHWAQNTNRNPWLWFFFGFFLPPIAGLVLLYKNRRPAPAPRTNDMGREDLLAVRKDLP
ncbi:MAG: hypothetical protein KDI75_11760 [Xanthomonadales bacterium]|nr:hypothetical protein [Xanthomonadales bacterium]